MRKFFGLWVFSTTGAHWLRLVTTLHRVVDVENGQLLTDKYVVVFAFPAVKHLTQYQVLNPLILNGFNQNRNAQRQKNDFGGFSYEHMIRSLAPPWSPPVFINQNFTFLRILSHQENNQNENCINYYCRTCSRYV